MKMTFYFAVFTRKINSLCFPTNVFLSNSYRTGGSFVCIYSSRSSHQRYSLKKCVLKIAKFLRTFFLQNTSEQLRSFFFLLKLYSHLPKKFCFICFIESLIKMMKNAFYFILKAFFVLNVFKFFSWFFDHVEKTAWLER